jgi:hypothetical protein
LVESASLIQLQTAGCGERRVDVLIGTTHAGHISCLHGEWSHMHMLGRRSGPTQVFHHFLRAAAVSPDHAPAVGLIQLPRHLAQHVCPHVPCSGNCGVEWQI